VISDRAALIEPYIPLNASKVGEVMELVPLVPRADKNGDGSVPSLFDVHRQAAQVMIKSSRPAAACIEDYLARKPGVSDRYGAYLELARRMDESVTRRSDA
jgi:hypothetical protein